MIQKNYTVVQSIEEFHKMEQHISEFDYFAFDTETTGLNVRKDKVIGLSICGKVGTAFYLPLFEWNPISNYLIPVCCPKQFQSVLEQLSNKELLMWNASYDIRIVKNNFNIDLTKALFADVMLMKHTIEEEGNFALKKVAIDLQDKLGLDIELEANEEQVKLKENVAANGGSTTQNNYEMYKADLDVMGPYACFAPNSIQVTMSDGSSKLIEDVQTGDIVISHTGKSKKVYDTLTQDYSGSVFDFEIESGRKIYNATSYHPFLILNQSTLKEEWVKAIDIKENDFMVRPTINKRNYSYITQSRNFWWLFGLYQAEGYVRIQKTVTYPVFTIHQDEVVHLASILKAEGYRFSCIKKGTSKGVDVVISDSKLGLRFLELSGGKFKCHEKKISEPCFSHLINEELDCLAFLSGVFDGDGSYRNKGKSHNYCLGITSASLVNIVDMMLTNLGINSTRGSYEPTKVTKGKPIARKRRHCITVFSNECEKLFIFSKFKQFIKNNNYSPSFKRYVRVTRIIEKDYIGKVHNIEVEEDHSYIANGIISHNCADADLTLRIAEYYKSRLEEEGLEEFFYDKEVMPLYKEVTIKMEEEGVLLDMPLILSAKESIEEDMLQFEKDIVLSLMSTFAAKKWKREKALEQYPAKNKGKFATKLLDIMSIPLEKTEKGSYSFTKKAIAKLPDSPYKRFLEGSEELPQSELDSISNMLFEEHDALNINSKKQMGDIVFSYMNVKSLGVTPGGLPKFDDKMIQELADTHEFDWAKKLSSYNKLVKIKGTYIDRFLDAQENGKYYFSYKQHGTISGRYSGDAQQLPRPKEEGELDPIVLKYVNLIRAFFISGKERLFIDCDYESLEPFVFADVSGDEGLRDIFRKGHDFYSTIAIATENLQEVSADKKAPDYLGKVNKPKRQSSKKYSLGVPYGMTDYALGKVLEISTEEAKKLIDGYLGGFPALKAWMDYSELQANVKGFVKSQAGRIRHLPKAKELYKYHKKNLLDHKYRRSLISKMAKKMPKDQAESEVLRMYLDYKNAVNNSKNFQIQSFGASIVNAACIAITREFKKRGINGHVCAQIHDQAIFDVPEDRAEECKEIVQRLMETTTKLSLDLKAPPVVARNWKDGH